MRTVASSSSQHWPRWTNGLTHHKETSYETCSLFSALSSINVITSFKNTSGAYKPLTVLWQQFYYRALDCFKAKMNIRRTGSFQRIQRLAIPGLPFQDGVPFPANTELGFFTFLIRPVNSPAGKQKRSCPVGFGRRESCTSNCQAISEKLYSFPQCPTPFSMSSRFLRQIILSFTVPE